MSEQTNVEKLKSERVQDEAQSRKRRLPRPDDTLGTVVGLTGNQAEQRLKSERVQERLKRMSGWRLHDGGKMIDRVRRFPDSLVAASYVAFASLLARQSGQPLCVSVVGKTISIGLTGLTKGADAGITEEVLDLAEQLG